MYSYVGLTIREVKRLIFHWSLLFDLLLLCTWTVNFAFGYCFCFQSLYIHTHVRIVIDGLYLYTGGMEYDRGCT